MTPSEPGRRGAGSPRRIGAVFGAADDVGNPYEILEESDHAEGEVRYYTRQGLPVRRVSATVFEILAPDLLEGFRTFTVTVADPKKKSGGPDGGGG